jgi:hypothetical protein
MSSSKPKRRSYGLYPAVGDPFVILSFASSVDPDVALCENRAGERYFHDADEIAGFHAHVAR